MGRKWPIRPDKPLGSSRWIRWVGAYRGVLCVGVGVELDEALDGAREEGPPQPLDDLTVIGAVLAPADALADGARGRGAVLSEKDREQGGSAQGKTGLGSEKGESLMSMCG